MTLLTAALLCALLICNIGVLVGLQNDMYEITQRYDEKLESQTLYYARELDACRRDYAAVVAEAQTCIEAQNARPHYIDLSTMPLPQPSGRVIR
jgi:hypothetical protein